MNIKIYSPSHIKHDKTTNVKNIYFALWIDVQLFYEITINSQFKNNKKERKKYDGNK